MKTARPTKADLAAWLTSWLMTELRLEPDQVASGKSFVNYGMDSIHSMMLVGDLEEYLHCRLSPTLAWDFPSLEALAEHLALAPPDEVEARQPERSAELLTRLDDLPDEILEPRLRSYAKDGDPV